MKTIPAALQTHLDGELHTLASLVKLSTRDGSVWGFTDHDQPITFESLTYQPLDGITPTALEQSSDLAVPTVDITGFLAATGVDQADIEAGKFDHAEFWFYLVNYASPGDGAVKLRRGYFGQVTVRDYQYTAEIRGLAQRLQQVIGEAYSSGCRADLGDTRCTVDLSGFTHNLTVLAVDGANPRTTFRVDDGNADGYFDFGLVTWDTGNNAGRQMEVKRHFTEAGGQWLDLYLPMPEAIQTGDTLTAIAGCDKKHETCAVKFSNTVNFRGEPYIPGPGALRRMEWKEPESEID